METPEQIRERLLACFPDAEIAVFANPALPAQPSLLLGAARAREIARHLRDDPALRLDYCSNATGVDWPDREIVDTVRTRVPAADGAGEKVIEEKITRRQPGCLEAVYHLYSMTNRHRLRLKVRVSEDDPTCPSLTPIWPGMNWHEREAWDLYGIRFVGHPNLKRVLMYEQFVGHPLRKDYPIDGRQPLVPLLEVRQIPTQRRPPPEMLNKP